MKLYISNRLMVFSFTCFFAVLFLVDVAFADDAQNNADADFVYSTAPLAVLVDSVEGNLSIEQAKNINKILEDSLFAFPNLSVILQREFSNQLGFLRKNKLIKCLLPEDCAVILKEQMGINSLLSLAVVERGDGKLNLKLKLIAGADEREFVETIPELSAVPVMLDRMIPDIFGLVPQMRIGQGVVRISSHPLFASVNINGIEVGKTPLSVLADNDAELKIVAHRPDHPQLQQLVKVIRGKVFRWHADLLIKQGQVLVDSNPSGASVFLDEKNVGVTPAIINNILMGEHTITLRMPPFADASYTVDVKGDALVRVKHGFKNEHATLIVNCANKQNSKTVEIFLNDSKVSENTYKADLPAGKYKVQIVQSGFVTFEETVELISGETTVLSPSLQKGFSLRPGEAIEQVADYRPGGFTTAFGALLLGFGVFLELEAQHHYDEAKNYAIGSSDRTGEEKTGRDSRIAGGVLMGVGAAATITGVILLIIPPSKQIAVTPEIDPKKSQFGLRLEYKY